MCDFNYKNNAIFGGRVSQQRFSFRGLFYAICSFLSDLIDQ